MKWPVLDLRGFLSQEHAPKALRNRKTMKNTSHSVQLHDSVTALAFV